MISYPSTLPPGLEIVKMGAIVPKETTFGTAITKRAIPVYTSWDSSEVVRTIPAGTTITLLDFEHNKYQVEDGWIGKNYLKIIDLGRFDTSMQRSFRNQ